jgi:hypothetical protein
MFEAKEIMAQNTDWISAVFFIILIILVVLKTTFNERLLHTGMLIFSKKYISNYFNKDKSGVLNLYQVLFFVLQVLIISLFLNVVYHFFETSTYSFSLNTYLIILSCVSLFFIIRFILGYILAVILNLKAIYKKILYEKINYLNSLILWMIIPLLLLLYTKNNYTILLWINIVLFVGLLIMRYGLLLKNNKSLLFNNLFYFILYLCALEISPLVIILKLTI